jgi:fatty acid desaturase
MSVVQGKNEASASNEKIWRQQFDVLVSAESIRSYSRQSLADTIGAVSVLWVETVVLLTAADLLPRLPLGWAIPAGIGIVLLMGLRMNAFGVILHEGSHGLLAKSRTLNDRLCNWAVAFWTINSVEEYRPTHRLHHRYLGQERDPDRNFYLVPARRGALTILLLQDLLGVTAVRRATTRISGTSQESDAPASLLARPQLLIGKFVTQVVVLGQFILFQGWARGLAFYVVFWLVPIVCMYPMILRLKTITEHFEPSLRDPSAMSWTARTSCASWLQNHLVGARMEYHFEHHVVPTIPYRGLKRLHRQLAAADLFAQHREVMSDGYVLFLTRAVLGSFGEARPSEDG